MELGLAADVGTLQRLPKVVGNQSWVRDLVYTARKVSAKEAFQFGLVRYDVNNPLYLPPTVPCHGPPYSQVYADKEDTFSNALKMAEDIASKSPVAVQGSKINMNYSRDHTVDEGLHFAVSLMHCLHSRPHCFCSTLQVVWNSAMLQSEDVSKAIMAAIQKEKAVFSKL